MHSFTLKTSTSNYCFRRQFHQRSWTVSLASLCLSVCLLLICFDSGSTGAEAGLSHQLALPFIVIVGAFKEQKPTNQTGDIVPSVSRFVSVAFFLCCKPQIGERFMNNMFIGRRKYANTHALQFRLCKVTMAMISYRFKKTLKRTTSR